MTEKPEEMIESGEQQNTDNHILFLPPFKSKTRLARFCLEKYPSQSRVGGGLFRICSTQLQNNECPLCESLQKNFNGMQTNVKKNIQQYSPDEEKGVNKQTAMSVEWNVYRAIQSDGHFQQKQRKRYAKSRRQGIQFGSATFV